jgi:DNA-binding SARP family transcriptional activator
VDPHDAVALVTTVEAVVAAGQPGRALAYPRPAVDLLDELLPGERAAAWIESARVSHGQYRGRARHDATGAALRTDSARTALAPAVDAVRLNPLDEAGYRQLMRANNMADEPARALHAYETCGSRSREFGVSPAPANPWTRTH